MAEFTVKLEVAAPASRVWATLTDWPKHGDWAPLTRVRVLTERADGVGAQFVARSGLGPLGFDDPMTVTHWQPPAGDASGDQRGRCDIDKHGTAIRGIAWFEVIPLPDLRSQVIWYEDVTVRPHRVTRYTGGLISLVGRIGFGRALRAMAEVAER